MISRGRDMLWLLAALAALPTTIVATSDTGNFTIVNGQIYTPGLAILDAPQPYTPEGGDFLQVALDISGDGQLPFPNNPPSSPTVIQNITLFLTSYTMGHNFTISNGSSAFTEAPLADILSQEPSSTVKHVNWLWPSCLVGDGSSSSNSGLSLDSTTNTSSTAFRGWYNISIHQTYRLNGSEYYTVFDLPISVTNSIPETPSSSAFGNSPAPGPYVNDTDSGNRTRIDCSLLSNPVLDWSTINASIHAPTTQPYLGGSVVVSGSSSTNSLGGSSSGSSSANVLGSGAGSAFSKPTYGMYVGVAVFSILARWTLM